MSFLLLLPAIECLGHFQNTDTLVADICFLLSASSIPSLGIAACDCNLACSTLPVDEDTPVLAGYGLLLAFGLYQHRQLMLRLQVMQVVV